MPPLEPRLRGGLPACLRETRHIFAHESEMADRCPRPIHDARMHTTCITELWLQSACAKSPLNIPSSHGFGADFNIFLGKIFGDLGSRISRRLSQAYSGYIYKKKPFPHPARTRQTQKHPDKFNTCPDGGLIGSLK